MIVFPAGTPPEGTVTAKVVPAEVLLFASSTFVMGKKVDGNGKTG